MTKFLTVSTVEDITFEKGKIYLGSLNNIPMLVRCLTPTTFTGNLNSSGGFVYTFKLSAFDWFMEVPNV